MCNEESNAPSPFRMIAVEPAVPIGESVISPDPGDERSSPVSFDRVWAQPFAAAFAPDFARPALGQPPSPPIVVAPEYPAPPPRAWRGPWSGGHPEPYFE